MDEASARRVILAQAIEAADTQGKLLSGVERGLIDRESRQAAQADGPGGKPLAVEQFLDLRAQRVLQAVEPRAPALAALKGIPSSRAWLAMGTPLATLLLGALTERIADPHRVDLLSLPLLAIVLWNLLIYLYLVVRWMRPLRQRDRPLLEAFARWADGLREWRRASGQVLAGIAALFYQRWQRVSSSMQLQRVTGVLHLAALGWGAGVAASLLVQGLVVQYRVGWESTFLDAQQVHAILSVLLMPVVALFPFEPFSVAEVAALQLGPGDTGSADPRWAWMYAALLLLVVIVPRAVLASIAFWRAAAGARRIGIDLDEPYFQRLISLLTPARVQLCAVVHRPQDRAALLRVLVQEAGNCPVLISSVHGDTLRLSELAGSEAPAAEAPGVRRTPWTHRLLAFARPKAISTDERRPDAGHLNEAREQSDVVLHLAGDADDLAAAKPLLQWLGKPVLVLVNRPEAAEAEFPGLVARCQSEARALPFFQGVLSFDAFARCWVQEGVLLDAIGRCLAPAKRPGFARIVAAWDERNQARFHRSLSAVAEHLLYAARQVEEVPGSALSVKSLVNTGERQAQAKARQHAMDAVVRRLEASAAQMFATLRALHGIGDAAAGALQHRLEEKFVVQQAVDTPQAGIAGAATGAAMGASVDLLVGGLTLGAATALGALVGGSAAFIAAAWKNRSTASGSTVVQLSEEMMRAMVEAALLRYLAVVHYGRGPAGAGDELHPSWKSDVAEVVAAHKEAVARFWTAARGQPDEVQSEVLARELASMARKLLERLYPEMRTPAREGREDSKDAKGHP
jgi:hypothetical protein